MLKKPLYIRIAVVVMILAADIIWGAGLICKWKQNDILIPSTQASSDISGFILQNLLISLIAVSVFVIFLLALKKDFAGELYLRVKSKWQRLGIGLGILVLLGIMVYHLASREEWITTVCLLFYYVFFIAFTEEFVCRGACTYLLKNEKSLVRYLVPNLLFAAMHIFNYSGWESLSGENVLHFIRSDMLILLGVGCAFQALKEKTGTIWIPVLLHAAWDFALAYK